jgi:hypothetical protein
MLFSKLVAGLRRLGREVLYDMGQAAFWSIASLSLGSSLRSVFRAGAATDFFAPDEPAVQPRRAVKRRPRYPFAPTA